MIKSKAERGFKTGVGGPLLSMNDVSYTIVWRICPYVHSHGVDLDLLSLVQSSSSFRKSELAWNFAALVNFDTESQTFR